MGAALQAGQAAVAGLTRSRRRRPRPPVRARLRQAAPRAVRVRRRVHPRDDAGPRRLVEGPAGQRLRPLPPVARTDRSPAPRLRRVLRPLRPRLRSAARRLRAGRRPPAGQGRLRRTAPAAGRAGARHRPNAAARSTTPCCTAPIDVQNASGTFGVEVIRKLSATTSNAGRQDKSVHPFTTSFGVRRRAHHHPPRSQLPHPGAVRHDARDRSRAVRAGHRRATLDRTPLATRHVDGDPRVAVAHVGELRRPQPPVLDRLLPAPEEALPRVAERRRAGRLLPGDQQGRAVADPGRGRRGDLQPAHHAALRARDRADERHAGGQGPARGVERRACATTWASRRPTTRRACCRTCTGRSAASATSRPTPWATWWRRSCGR